MFGCDRIGGRFFDVLRRKVVIVTIDSGPEKLSRKGGQVARRNAQAEIGPDLRRDVIEAAEKIYRTHKAELADVIKAHRAVGLFSARISRDHRESNLPTGISRDADKTSELLAEEVGGLVANAIRAGAGLLEASLVGLAQAWTASTAVGRRPSSEGSFVARPSRRRRDVGPTAASAAPVEIAPLDRAAASDDAPKVRRGTREEEMIQGVLNRFMPMLVTALNQGSDGYGLARTVIALFGRPIYDQASALGHDRIMELVKTEPQLWAQVAPIEGRFTRFLDEFTNYDAHMNTESPIP